MNNIESMKNTLEAIKNSIFESSEKLNEVLSTIGIEKENFDNAILKIEKQIESAENKFTIAFVGTFKTGKSTIINSLLNLQGNARLSSEDDPDTAKCIRIIKKNESNYEAEVDFGGEYPLEKLSWNEAKKYTSQVALDEADDQFRAKADKITEVRYYVDSPLLDLCNILDLPGTGTGKYGEHTAVTDEKIMESDCFFWVLSTDCEPSIESIKNLKKIRHKLLPIINVWQFERDDIQGEFKPEEIIDIVRDGYEEYLANADDPVVYYAKEIDVAQQEGNTVKNEWGKTSFVEKVQEIISNVQAGDRAKRIKKNMIDALSDCRSLINDVRDDSKVKELYSISQKNKSQINKQYLKLDRCNSLARNDIADTAKKTTDEILDIIAKASESFIQNQMSGSDLRHIFRSFTKKQKEKMSEELSEEFKKNYLRFDSGWIEDAIQGFSDDVFSILKSKYIDFSCSLFEENNQNVSDFNPGEFTEFIDMISSQIQKDFQGKSIKLLSNAAVMAILFFIPGLNLLDSIAAIFAVGNGVGSFADDSKIRSKINMIIVQSKVQIRQQKYTIVKQLKDQGEIIGKEFYAQIENKLDMEKQKMNEEIDRFRRVDRYLEEFENIIAQAEIEIKNLLS